MFSSSGVTPSSSARTASLPMPTTLASKACPRIGCLGLRTSSRWLPSVLWLSQRPGAPFSTDAYSRLIRRCCSNIFLYATSSRLPFIAMACSSSANVF
ncbi:uncharacterized protein B0I36DRAFT_313647 [Microdochium trichocladiopsis]|uniref:Uncharacterized protein n=1 Tax=Microdochium trichocladiopsis TaxID=1682393 RepID=A0A9P9BUA2_9PEZI|nr:uncharacterized protein B0I36DRAFT_313647 [Microdochium trichocladiopsis]KAH7037259.1 hypothetical protein B0I36DRAFT_313647 [Microdochium trichocladiopsis]